MSSMERSLQRSFHTMIFSIWSTGSRNHVRMSSVERSLWRRFIHVLGGRQRLLSSGIIHLFYSHCQLETQVMEKIRSKKLEPVCDCKKDCVRWIWQRLVACNISQIPLHIEHPESRATWTAKLWVLGEKINTRFLPQSWFVKNFIPM